MREVGSQPPGMQDGQAGVRAPTAKDRANKDREETEQARTKNQKGTRAEGEFKGRQHGQRGRQGRSGGRGRETAAELRVAGAVGEVRRDGGAQAGASGPGKFSAAGVCWAAWCRGRRAGAVDAGRQPGRGLLAHRPAEPERAAVAGRRRRRPRRRGRDHASRGASRATARRDRRRERALGGTEPRPPWARGVVGGRQP